MRTHINQSYLLLIILSLFLFNCKKKTDDTNGSGNGNGNGGGGNGGGNNNGGAPFVVTGTSPEYLYWGDELIINGTGFSTNKGDYKIKFMTDLPGCDIGPFEITSAAATQVKVKIPFGTLTNTIKKCGPSSDPLIITINGKSDTTDVVKFLGWPRIQGVCTHFGGSAGDYLIPGDSAALNMAGATGIFASINRSDTNAVLTVDGANMPVAWRNYTACFSSLGGVITLDKETYGKLKCPTDPDWGGGGRNILFKLTTPGTNRFDTLSIFVNWLPRQGFSQHIGSPNISKSAGGFPTWKIYGTNMSYKKARFTATNCSLTTQEIDISHNSIFYDEGTIAIPLSILTVGCNYSVSIVSHCGNVRVLGGLMITP